MIDLTCKTRDSHVALESHYDMGRDYSQELQAPTKRNNQFVHHQTSLLMLTNCWSVATIIISTNKQGPTKNLQHNFASLGQLATQPQKSQKQNTSCVLCFYLPASSTRYCFSTTFVIDTRQLDPKSCIRSCNGWKNF